ncbi:MAG: dihydropyrimidinase, partial [Alphaproteobacteria bacterium]|nr:dihydropyrimidinase [Alphaproteobacteria bacterium]
MASILIRGGTVVNADISERADVLIRDGKIAAVGEGLSGDTVI